MALNPVAYTETVVSNFLRYQMTAYPFADPDLYAQMRRLLSLDETRRTPLLRGPYVSLSRPFREGAPVAQLVGEGLLHPLMTQIHPYPSLYGHQEKALRSVLSGQTMLVSTGTGSGKSECFLYPIISRSLTQRDQHVPPGITAVIVYPMNALAEDQLTRLRELLVGTGVTFGMYVGKTPEKSADVPGLRLKAGASRADYAKALEKVQKDKQSGGAVHPAEERCSREEMRTPGMQPRILLTNVKQLELLLTRQADIELFDNARLDFLVFDEAHTYGGAAGAETACLIRRLRSFCGKGTDQTVCIATSATIADPERGPDAAKDFAARFFGVPEDEVALVGEEYREDDWAKQRTTPAPPPGVPADHLRDVLKAVHEDDDHGAHLAAAYQGFTGQALPEVGWQEALYDHLAANELVYQLADTLRRPLALPDLLIALKARVGRPVTEEELLTWLALGAAARNDARPLLRPVVHGFVRGVGGAVVTFPSAEEKPCLYLAADEAETASDGDPLAHLSIWTCYTCGQHYFEHHVADFTYDGNGPGGGEAVGNDHLWRPLDAALGGKRLVLMDRLLSAEDEDDDPPRTAPVSLCRRCGALVSSAQPTCPACGRSDAPVRLLAIAEKPDNPGKLTRCVSCGTQGRGAGGRYREPIRQVRATAVADVHVLAQEMVGNAERPRLLVFADNRQDAAFQAGWMRDHARHFRLRSLIDAEIEKGPLSPGDLTHRLDKILAADDNLSRALAPEVWNYFRKEAAGVQHAEERKRFLRIQVIRELATGGKQRQGLEPLGRLQVDYLGLTPEASFVVERAALLGVEPALLAEGIAGLLDRLRRSLYIFDREGHIFSKMWLDGDQEVMRGYLPVLRGVPKGLKLEIGAAERSDRLMYWIGTGGDTNIRQIVRKWGVSVDGAAEWIRALWAFLADDLRLLAPVTLQGARGNPLPGCHGAHQVDADRMMVAPHRGLWRCKKCRRAQVRTGPFDKCLAWRCDSTLVFEPESADNYDLQMLTGAYRMLLPREHSAQVPAEDREQLERQFKGESEAINTLVCTPTLELGVDIGALDAVLMRNVPPLPANYWQRAGRAGRRHRMAVNITYARPSSHDQSYFAEPEKMLNGLVNPPRFNLRNEVMVGKHVRASILTRLHQLIRQPDALSDEDRAEVQDTLAIVLPRQVSGYLFDEAGELRAGLFDVSPLQGILDKHEADLLASVTAIFSQGWPPSDSGVVTPELLRGFIRGMTLKLQDAVQTLKKRLDWALDQIHRLDDRRRSRGTLEPDEDALFQRCDRLVKRFKGMSSRTRREAQGFDDINTYAVLGAEGFLPGYGLEVGAVVGTANVPRHLVGVRDFELPRPASIALREYVPGNLIYANANRFVPRYFHLDAGGDHLRFQIDPASETVSEAGVISQSAAAGLDVALLPAIPICDVDMAHQSNISDDEDFRFQMPVAVYGYEQNRHSGGAAYTWGERALQLRRGVHFRLVNVGAARMLPDKPGYPVCLVCGQSRSPFASETELAHFREDHIKRCGKAVEDAGFYADVVADALTLADCASREEAYSLAEALRTGAAQVLEMERDDLEILVMGRPGSDSADAILYDPMPGGSGLLDQIAARFAEVVDAALAVTGNCPADCARACIDCLFTFRNAFFHKHLDRKLAGDLMAAWGDTLTFAHGIPPVLPTTGPKGSDMAVNNAEQTLQGMLSRAGFPAGEWHKQIALGIPLGTTSPDAFFGSDDEDEPGTVIYLDGLSAGIHGNPQTQAKDYAIRTALENKGFDVIRIAASDLSDQDAMAVHFYRLGRALLGRDKAKAIRENRGWYDATDAGDN